MSVSFAQQNGNASSILRNELLQDAASLCNSAASHAMIVIFLSASSISSSSNSFWRSVIAFLLDLQPSHKLACSSFCSSISCSAFSASFGSLTSLGFFAGSIAPPHFSQLSLQLLLQQQESSP